MKRLLLMIAILASGLTIFAQDIIVTRDAKRIDAKVLEINIDNVRYKDFENQDGPIYTIPKQDIASIIYQNGKVETFLTQTTPVAPQAQPTQPTQPTPQAQQPNVQQNPQGLTAEQFNRMDDDDIDIYLRQNENGKIYETFHSGMNLRSSGKKMLTAGIVLSGAGLLSTVLGYVFMVETAFGYGYYFEDFYTAYVFYCVGYGLMGVGQGLCIASIPLSAVGGSKKRWAKNEYIDQYLNGGRTTYVPTLDFNYTGNGFGLVLKF